MSWEVLQTESMFQGRAFSVRRDTVRTESGRVVTLEVVEHVASVTLVPLDSQSQVWFVSQYRHATGEHLLELPAGTLDFGETPEACARRECREEIGMAPGRLRLLGSSYLAPGYSTEFMSFFLAQDLTPDALTPDEDEVIRVERVPIDRALQMASSGALRDAKSIVGLHLAWHWLQAA